MHGAALGLIWIAATQSLLPANAMRFRYAVMWLTGQQAAGHRQPESAAQVVSACISFLTLDCKPSERHHLPCSCGFKRGDGYLEMRIQWTRDKTGLFISPSTNPLRW